MKCNGCGCEVVLAGEVGGDKCWRCKCCLQREEEQCDATEPEDVFIGFNGRGVTRSVLLTSLLEEWYLSYSLPPAETPGFQLWHWIREELDFDE